MGPPATRHRPPLVAAALSAVALATCKPAEPPRSAANVAPPAPVRRFRTPRVGCEAPAPPAITAGWALEGWPAVPRFLSVEAEGAVLYATTTATVCRSVDGGRRWEPLLVDLDAPSLIAVEGARIVLRAEEAFEGSETVDTVWWVTDDAGTHWQRHARPPEVGQGRIARIAIHARDVEGEYAAVSCGDAYYAVVPSVRGRVPVALRSETGGVTWSRMTLPRALRQPGVTFRCVGHDAVVLERGGAVPLVTAFSRDRGAHWESVVRMPAAARAADADGAGDESDLPSSGCAPLAGRGVFCEVRGQAWASSDRGRRWYRANSPVGGRAVPMHGEFLLGVGGGIARSTDAGRQWEMVTVAPGRANLGFRGGVVSSESYWIAGTAMWWTDDGGQRWTASQLPFELVAVLSRDRWIGLRPDAASDGCGVAMVTTTRGQLWRPALTVPVRRVVERAGELRAWACGGAARMFVSGDGFRWRVARPEPEPEEETDEPTAAALDGARVELRDGALHASGPGGPDEVVAASWPRDIAPVAVASGEGRARVVVFGNGTVLRRP